MIMERFLDGNKILGTKYAEEIRKQVSVDTRLIFEKIGIKPRLVVILVGDNPASHIYVNNKKNFAGKCGIDSDVITLPREASERELLDIIAILNSDVKTHGILVQMPLPQHINSVSIIKAISHHKDVDGFHTHNMGALLTKTTTDKSLLPCTPIGCMYILHSLIPKIRGLNAVVIGASNIVGKPIAAMLINEGATVSVLNSSTQNKRHFTLEADIIITACGIPNVIGQDDIKDGVTILDVGINRLESGQIVGDCNFFECKTKANFITPVPGGIGPMTIAMLLRNTIIAMKGQIGMNL